MRKVRTRLAFKEFESCALMSTSYGFLRGAFLFGPTRPAFGFSSWPLEPSPRNTQHPSAHFSARDARSIHDVIILMRNENKIRHGCRLPSVKCGSGEKSCHTGFMSRVSR